MTSTLRISTRFPTSATYPKLAMSHNGALPRRNGMDTQHRNPTEVAIIGGGLAGLTAAATLASHGKRAVVYERHRSPGGDARSSTHEGFIFNRGPHALYRGGAAERTLAGLGVAIRGGVPPVKGRIVFGNESFIAPAGPATLLQTKGFSARDKVEIAKVLGKVPKLRPSELASLTVTEWIDGLVTRERPRLLLQLLSLSLIHI